MCKCNETTAPPADPYPYGATCVSAGILGNLKQYNRPSLIETLRRQHEDASRHAAECAELGELIGLLEAEPRFARILELSRRFY